jgi:hypothetical protein
VLNLEKHQVGHLLNWMVANIDLKLTLILQSLNSLNNKKTRRDRRIFSLRVGHRHPILLGTEVVAKGILRETTTISS